MVTPCRPIRSGCASLAPLQPGVATEDGGDAAAQTDDDADAVHTVDLVVVTSGRDWQNDSFLSRHVGRVEALTQQVRVQERGGDNKKEEESARPYR